jgi:hypothetical protein
MSLTGNTARAETPAIPASLDREPHLFRFGLRHLFLYMSLAAVLLALLARLGGPWPMVVASCVSLVGAHVFGTFVGTRLRDTSQEVQRWKARSGSPDRDGPIASLQPTLATFTMPETTPLAARSHGSPLHWATLAIGTVFGAALGVGGLSFVAQRHITWIGLALGGVSCAVMGAGLGLIACSFVSISKLAWRHATRDQPSR